MDRRMITSRRIRKTWLPVAQTFTLLCILVWLDEILDLPHLLLGAPRTPINWREAIGETALIATVGLLAVSRLVRDITARMRTEKSLRRARQDWETIFQAIGQSSLILNPQHRVIEANRAAVMATGRPKEELLGKTCYEIFHGTDRPPKGCPLEKMLISGHLETTEMEIETLRGLFLVSCTPVFDDTDHLEKIIHIATDITERKRAEDLIRAQRNLGLALSAAVGLEETLQLCLDAAIRASGLDCGGIYLVDEVSGNIDLVFHQELPADFVSSASHYDADSDNARLIMAGKPVYGRHQELGVSLNDVRRHEDLRAIAIIPVHHEGRIIACLNVASHTLDELPAFARNALETIAAQIGSTIARARAEQTLQESEERLRAVFESAQDAIFTKDREGRYTRVNNACASLFGLAPDEMTGKTDFDLFPPDVARRIREQDRRVLEKGEPVSVEDTNPTAGGMRTFHIVKVPLRDTNGEIVGICGITRDITERKQAEEDLKASKEYINNIIDSSLDMIIACDMKRHIVEFNRAAEKTFGYRREEVIGEHVDMLYADPQESLAVHETTVREGRCVREIRDRRKNGEVFPAFLSASLLHDVSGEVVGVMGVARDITARKRAEEALQRRNRELALLNRASQALTSTLDMDQVLTTILEEMRHLLDVTAASVWLIDRKTDELVCQQVIGPQKEIVHGGRLAPGRGRAGWVARAGESLIVPDAWADERYFKDVDQQTGLPLRSILTIPLRVARSETGHDGAIGVLQVVDTQVDRFQPTDLRLAESLATTAAIAIENARLYEQTRQDAETKSVLLDEISHRVKNNLSAIIGLLYTELRYADMDSQATYQSVIQNLVNQVRGLATVHSLLSASGWAPLRLGELVGPVIRSSLQTLPHDKHVSVSVEDVIPSPVHVTPDQAQNLALVINELATNTVKHALQDRDTAHITVRVTTEIEGDGVQVEFRDDGPGYPEEVLRLERHNVGLDLVQNVVRKNLRGELSLYNDHGAVAVIKFKEEANYSAAPAGSSDPAAGQGKLNAPSQKHRAGE